MSMHAIKTVRDGILGETIWVLGGDMSRRPLWVTPHNHSGDEPMLSLDFDERGGENVTFMDLEELKSFIVTLQRCKFLMEQEARNL